MKTFWLLGKTDDDDIIFPDSDSEKEIMNTNNATDDIPGEIFQYTSFKSALPIPLPGRTTKCGISSLEGKITTSHDHKITAYVLPRTNKTVENSPDKEVNHKNESKKTGNLSTPKHYVPEIQSYCRMSDKPSVANVVFPISNKQKMS